MLKLEQAPEGLNLEMRVLLLVPKFFFCGRELLGALLFSLRLSQRWLCTPRQEKKQRDDYVRLFGCHGSTVGYIVYCNNRLCTSTTQYKPSSIDTRHMFSVCKCGEPLSFATLVGTVRTVRC